MSKQYTSRNPLRILYEDAHCVAFFKPAGLLTVPAGDGRARTLEALANQDPAFCERTHGGRLYICHRLDRETSGVILLARGKQDHDAFVDLFRRREIHKKYIAFVHGRLSLPRGEISLPVRDAYEDRFSPGTKPKDALTRYRLVDQRKDFAVVEAEPVTGRTNQLRIHFKAIGHPIVGESKYIFRKDFTLKFKRTALHAAEIAFIHPATKQEVVITAPLAKDMRNFLEKNRNGRHNRVG